MGGGGAFIMNGIKTESPMSPFQQMFEVTLGDNIFPPFVKADINDNCILGFDFTANFKSDRLSDDTVTIGDSVIPIQVSS